MAALTGVSACSTGTHNLTIEQAKARAKTLSSVAVPSTIRPLKNYRIDESTGQLTLPLDKFSANFAQLQTLDYATQVLDRQCLARVGVDLPLVDLRSEKPGVSRLYGMWLERQINSYGYKLEPESRTVAERLRVGSSVARSPRQVEALQACREQNPAYKELAEIGGNISIPVANAYDRVLKSPQGQAVIMAWRSCLTSNGVAVDPEPRNLWLPTGLPVRDDAEAKRIGLTDVACKRKVKLVETLLSLEADAQERIVNANRPALEAKAANLKRILKRADAIIAHRD